jgi:hypothetical protein
MPHSAVTSDLPGWTSSFSTESTVLSRSRRSVEFLVTAHADHECSEPAGLTLSPALPAASMTATSSSRVAGRSTFLGVKRWVRPQLTKVSPLFALRRARHHDTRQTTSAGGTP